MATRVLLHLGDATNKCIFSNVQFHRTSFQVRNAFRQNRHFRRMRQGENGKSAFSESSSPFTHVHIQSSPPSGKKLLKGFIFATTFSGAAFLGATILEYERIRSETFKGLNRLPFSRTYRSSSVGFRSDIKNWWDNLSEGQRLFYFICYANVIVFIGWKIPKLQSTMLKYFASNPASNVTCAPMVLSMFSHYNLWHLAANMYVLHSFSTAGVAHLGPEHFLALYLSSGILSSFASNLYKTVLGCQGFSLGASGAIMGVLAFICSQYPDTKLSIILLPQFTFSAGMAIKSLLTFDAAGCLLGWRIFDHAAHLGGAFFGLFWQYWGVENIWRKRSPILSEWHELRNPRKSN